MLQGLVKKGKITAIKVPCPTVSPGTVLIKVMYSCISPGTELAGIQQSGQSLFRKALDQPEKVKRVLEQISTQGLSQTLNQVRTKLDAYAPMGYSISGVVVGVGSDIQNFRTGDRVAAAGAGWANHAEFVEVPKNLVVKLPENVSWREASTGTLGTIALQGLRRADVKLGEFVAVMGLGTLGQLAVQLCKSAGCHVIGIDLLQQRLELAEAHGADRVLNSTTDNVLEKIAQVTGGHGVDAVLFTAATGSSEPLSQAFKLCRKKGKVVLVGVAGPEVRREDIYEKELDFLVSCSYGPGRYDPEYEINGNDYPYAYVRWTENRNLQAYLDLIAQKAIRIDSLAESVFPIERIEQAYQSLSSDRRPLMVLLEYNQDLPDTLVSEKSQPKQSPAIRTNARDRVNVGLVGLGSFATGMHLPNLKKLSNLFRIYGLADKVPHVAKTIHDQYQAQVCTCDYQQLLADPNVDLIMICTRHHLHAPMVLETLQAGKHVFVEKPLAMTTDELDQVRQFFEQRSADAPILQTGFNRRFSPHIRKIHQTTKDRTNPMILNYRMNAGYIPLDHWVHNAEGGGRNIGEACHIYDLFTFLTGSRVVSIDAKAISPKTEYYSYRDNFIATLGFEDGSIATLTYTALGSPDYPKEHLDVYVEGKVFTMTDYKQLSVYGAKTGGLETKGSDKGHLDELDAIAQAIKNGGDWPIPLWQQIQAMEIAFAVDSLLQQKGLQTL